LWAIVKTFGYTIQPFLLMLLMAVGFCFADPVSPAEESFPLIILAVVVVCLFIECIVELLLLNRYNILPQYLVPTIFIVNLLSYLVSCPFLFVNAAQPHYARLFLVEMIIVIFETAVIYLVSILPTWVKSEGNKLPILSAFLIMSLGNSISLFLSYISFWQLSKLIFRGD
jgi:hypothetical protein